MLATLTALILFALSFRPLLSFFEFLDEEDYVAAGIMLGIAALIARPFVDVVFGLSDADHLAYALIAPAVLCLLRGLETFELGDRAWGFTGMATGGFLLALDFWEVAAAVGGGA